MSTVIFGGVILSEALLILLLLWFLGRVELRLKPRILLLEADMSQLGDLIAQIKLDQKAMRQKTDEAATKANEALNANASQDATIASAEKIAQDSLAADQAQAKQIEMLSTRLDQLESAILELAKAVAGEPEQTPPPPPEEGEEEPGGPTVLGVRKHSRKS